MGADGENEIACPEGERMGERSDLRNEWRPGTVEERTVRIQVNRFPVPQCVNGNAHGLRRYRRECQFHWLRSKNKRRVRQGRGRRLNHRHAAGGDQGFQGDPAIETIGHGFPTRGSVTAARARPFLNNQNTLPRPDRTMPINA